MDLGGEPSKKSKFEKLKRPKLIGAIVAIIAVIAITLYFFLPTLTGPGALTLYLEEEQPVEPNQEVNLIVEYRNTLREDVEEVRIEVEPIAKEKIEIIGENEKIESRVGAGQIRQFRFPVNLKNVTRGSTYAIEVSAVTPQKDFTERISIKIDGGL